MSGAALSIKLRCASWQQLATIYKRDLSRGSMFLKATTQPPIGTIVKIDLELPSATVIELQGTIVKHVVDPQRGTGVELQLDPLPTRSVWLIESALAAETKVRAQSQGGAAPSPATTTGPQSAISDGQELAAAEAEPLERVQPLARVELGGQRDQELGLGVGEVAALAERRHLRALGLAGRAPRLLLGLLALRGGQRGLDQPHRALRDRVEPDVDAGAAAVELAGADVRADHAGQDDHRLRGQRQIDAHRRAERRRARRLEEDRVARQVALVDGRELLPGRAAQLDADGRLRHSGRL